jgi:hypothetical protein
MRDIAAIDHERSRLRATSRGSKSLHALHRLFTDARDRDGAWRAASALVLLGEADHDERHRFERDRPRAPIRPKHRLDDTLWLTHLRHPDEDLVVSKLLEQLWPAVLGLRGMSDRDAGLSAKHLVDPRTSTVTLASTFGWAADTLGLRQPRLYLREDVSGGLTHMPVFPLASLSGATLLTGFEPADLIFIVGRHLSDYRGEHYVRTLLPSVHELRMVLLAGLRIAGLGPADPRVDAVAAELVRKLVPAQLSTLGVLTRAMLSSAVDVDVARWRRGVELTACRAGLLLCDDLSAAARMIRALGAGMPDDVSFGDKIDELIQFSVSDDYGKLRRALGIACRFG